MIVVARLFRVEHELCLHHSRWTPGTRAVLIIPWYGAPHLVLLTGRRRRCDVPPGGLVFEDDHVVADTGRARAWRESAVVLVSRGPARLLGRYPGCSVAVERARGGWLLGLRDGTVLRAEGAAGLGTAGLEGWAGACGSLLHCWTTAGLPADTIADAVVIVGRQRKARRLAVAGRLLFRPVRVA